MLLSTEFGTNLVTILNAVYLLRYGVGHVELRDQLATSYPHETTYTWFVPLPHPHPEDRVPPESPPLRLREAPRTTTMVNQARTVTLSCCASDDSIAPDPEASSFRPSAAIPHGLPSMLRSCIFCGQECIPTTFCGLDLGLDKLVKRKSDKDSRRTCKSMKKS